jgi:hypothetical protein
VGKEQDVTLNVGKLSLHEETNNDGWRMVDFAIARKMPINSTLFQHKRIHQETWRSPDGLTSKQIDGPSGLYS